jgi:hypothetical protein
LPVNQDWILVKTIVDTVVLKKREQLRKPHGDRVDAAKITAFAFLFYKKISGK